MARGGRHRRVAYATRVDRYFRRTQSETVFDSHFAHVDRQSSAKLAGTPGRYAFVVIGVLGGTPHSSWRTPMHRACKFATENLRRMSSLSLTGGFVVGDLAKVRAGRDHRPITSRAPLLTLVPASWPTRLAKAPPPRVPARWESPVPSRFSPQRPTREQGLPRRPPPPRPPRAVSALAPRARGRPRARRGGLRAPLGLLGLGVRERRRVARVPPLALRADAASVLLLLRGTPRRRPRRPVPKRSPQLAASAKAAATPASDAATARIRTPRRRRWTAF